MFSIDETPPGEALLANVHVVRLCSAGIPLCKLNQTFFHRCLSAVSASRTEKPEVDDVELRLPQAVHQALRGTHWHSRCWMSGPDLLHGCAHLYSGASAVMT
ncbi:g804 [Coccomyxa elongata]